MVIRMARHATDTTTGIGIMSGSASPSRDRDHFIAFCIPSERLLGLIRGSVRLFPSRTAYQPPPILMWGTLDDDAATKG